MIPEFGFPYVWICVGNLLGVLVLQYMARIQRPIDFDSSLYAHAHSDPDTSGFPCVDTHMAVVVVLPVILHIQSPVLQTGLVLIMLHIGLAKLFVATRFASQVVGSYLTGVTGILVGNHGDAVVKSYNLTRGYKYVSVCVYSIYKTALIWNCICDTNPNFQLCDSSTAAIVVLIVFLMFVLGTWIENNDSRLIGIPKQDFVDVLTNILGSDVPNLTPSSDSASRPARVHQFPASQRGSSSNSEISHEDHDEDDEEQVIVGKRDSFYFLMKAMKARERRRYG